MELSDKCAVCDSNDSKSPLFCFPCFHLVCGACHGDMINDSNEKNLKYISCVQCGESVPADAILIERTPVNYQTNPGQSKFKVKGIDYDLYVPECPCCHKNIVNACEICKGCICPRKRKHKHDVHEISEFIPLIRKKLENEYNDLMELIPKIEESRAHAALMAKENNAHTHMLNQNTICMFLKYLVMINYKIYGPAPKKDSDSDEEWESDSEITDESIGGNYSVIHNNHSNAIDEFRKKPDELIVAAVARYDTIMKNIADIDAANNKTIEMHIDSLIQVEERIKTVLAIIDRLAYCVITDVILYISNCYLIIDRAKGIMAQPIDHVSIDLTTYFMTPINVQAYLEAKIEDIAFLYKRVDYYRHNRTPIKYSDDDIFATHYEDGNAIFINKKELVIYSQNLTTKAVERIINKCNHSWIIKIPSGEYIGTTINSAEVMILNQQIRPVFRRSTVGCYHICYYDNVIYTTSYLDDGLVYAYSREESKTLWKYYDNSSKYSTQVIVNPHNPDELFVVYVATSHIRVLNRHEGTFKRMFTAQTLIEPWFIQFTRDYHILIYELGIYISLWTIYGELVVRHKLEGIEIDPVNYKSMFLLEDNKIMISNKQGTFVF